MGREKPDKQKEVSVFENLNETVREMSDNLLNICKDPRIFDVQPSSEFLLSSMKKFWIIHPI